MRLKQKIFLALAVVILGVGYAFFASNKSYDTEIDKEIAASISENMFLDYTLRTGNDENQFSKPTIEEVRDGWEFSYVLKSDNSRRLGIFVDKFGKTDYSEAP